LGRKDFSIISFAIQLNKQFYGVVRDFYDSLKDANKQSISALHSLSFIEGILKSSYD
jgi:tRNA nucleotidyltransferase/poly(A) polymerase